MKHRWKKDKVWDRERERERYRERLREERGLGETNLVKNEGNDKV